ncbi:hypothetical protein [Lysinibacillus antri]|uniref:Uncharacterized protein n=1 Tax=Lysinibacillus antri TaxID=2498145 RepID=A0A432LIV6_9BACI|nr:hypothetical protein [Lysinibacillus antri]RUL56983.1 hypothetical protein EK386_00755 [Lysinibacillus antri]
MSKDPIKDSLQFIFTENNVYDHRTNQRILYTMAKPHKRKKFLFMPLATSFCLLLGLGIWIATMLPSTNQNANTDTEQSSIQQQDDLEMGTDAQKIADLEFQIGAFEDERAYYHEVIDQLLPNLSDEEMLEFAKSHFSYEFTVNHEPLPATGQMEVAAGEVTVMLNFKMVPHYNVLSEEWYQKGMISGDYFAHIEKVEPANGEMTYADGANVTAQGYRFANAESGSKITLTISEELKERLALKTSKIEILVK